MEDVLDLFGLRCGQKGLDLAYICDAATPIAIVSDSSRLRQVLVNLVGNAVKFTDQGQVVVEISSKLLERHEIPMGNEYLALLNEERFEEEQWVELYFQVRDTGPGIPADRMNRLFRTFSQVDTSVTRKHGGTGLGLIIAKRLIEAMGGKIWVESEVGAGTTFHFTLCSKSTRSTNKICFIAPAELKHQRVLIVDDAEINRRILNVQAERWGMIPQVFEKPTEALKWLEGQPALDLALVDLQMPGMDGCELARTIHALERYHDLPIILLSSSLPTANSIVLTEAFAARLMKPIKQADLSSAILTAIGKRKIKTARLSSIIEPTFASNHPFRILLVEDNLTNQKVAARMLQKLGYRVDVVANGNEALEALERQGYDIIFMDVQMPEMDGIEATRRICHLYPPSERAYIIAMTAHAMKDDRQMCLDAGMDDYLSKPIRAEEVQSALEHAAVRLKAK